MIVINCIVDSTTRNNHVARRKFYRPSVLFYLLFLV